MSWLILHSKLVALSLVQSYSLLEAGLALTLAGAYKKTLVMISGFVISKDYE